MAVQHANRGIVKKDLQLYYNREYNGSFLGEATVNLFSIPAYTLQKEGNHATSFATSTSSGVPDLVVSGNKQVYYVSEYYTLVATGAWVAESNRLIIYPKTGSGATTSYAPAGTYRISFYARSLSGNTNLGFAFYGNSINNTATLTSKWQRFSANSTHGGAMIIEFGNLNAGSMVCQIACIQVEAKSYATPFTVPVLWTPNLVNVTSTSGHTTITRGGTNNNDWTQARIFSSEGISGPCYVSFKASQVSSALMIGLNNDPSTGINYTNLDYAWYASWDLPSPNTPAFIYENGTAITPSSNIYSTSTVFEIIYDGSNVNYYMDGVLKRSVARASTLPLYLDSSFYSANGGGAINSLSFGPLSQINRFSNYVIGGGGLLDISGNNVNTDLGNVSFDSTGYIFTGASSNRIQFTTPTSFIYSAAGKTVLMWVKYSSTGYVGFCGLGNAANGQSFNLRSTAATVQYLGFMGYNADYDPSAGPQINNNVWHLIGVTFDAYGAGNLKLYLDGVNIASTTITLNTGAEASNIGYIGRSSHGGGNEGYFTGQVGQFMIYNRALSADEVLQIFNSQRKTYGI